MDPRIDFHNYRSYEEHQEGAEQLLRKEEAAGWMQWHETKEKLDRACGGPATLSKIGALAKTQGDRVKLRRIHDLRRSAVNSRVKMPERVILPRLRDARDSILELIAKHGGNAWELMGLDFSDALNKYLFIHGKGNTSLDMHTKHLSFTTPLCLVSDRDRLSGAAMRRC